MSTKKKAAKKAAGKSKTKSPAKSGKKVAVVARKSTFVADPRIVKFALENKEKYGTCALVRKVRKQFKSARRIEIEKSLSAKGLNIKLGTIRRQIQFADDGLPAKALA